MQCSGEAVECINLPIKQQAKKVMKKVNGDEKRRPSVRDVVTMTPSNEESIPEPASSYESLKDEVVTHGEKEETTEPTTNDDDDVVEEDLNTGYVNYQKIAFRCFR